jgi:chromate transporter
MIANISTVDWQSLFTHFLSLSLLAVGGTSVTIPDMYIYLVVEKHWLTDSQFISAIGLSRAMPGPNVLFIAILGWDVGINSTGENGSISLFYGLCGAMTTMLGTIIPSATLTFFVARWGQENKSLLAVQAFKTGMAPIVSALLIVAGWLMINTHDLLTQNWKIFTITAVSTIVAWRTKLHFLWMLGGGALLGLLGLI